MIDAFVSGLIIGVVAGPHLWVAWGRARGYQPPADAFMPHIPTTGTGVRGRGDARP